MALVAAALVVVVEAGTGCPEGDVLAARLREAGVTVEETEDVRVRFGFTDDRARRVAAIDVPGAEPRRIEHAAADCGSLADATIALLSVLLDRSSGDGARPGTAPAPTPTTPAATAASTARFRIEADAVFSSGIVASFAVGVGVFVGWKPLHWATVGLVAEGWPERDHPAGQGLVADGEATCTCCP